MKWHLFVFSLIAFPLMLKINSFHYGYRFRVYVRVVAVRCGTSLQPMLVKDLSTSSSIGRSLVLVSCYRNCIIILLNCHRDCSLPWISSEATKTNMGCLCQQIINMFPGLGKESGGCWRGREDIKIQLIYNPTNVSLPNNL